MSLETLFPLPSRPAECWDQTPRSFPGITPESSQKLAELMRLNDERYHIFFNQQGFHNHLTHHILAAWSLGASSTGLEEIFGEHSSYQRAKLNSPDVITDQNWTSHLGHKNESYYQAYRSFFAEKLSRPDGINKTLEEYIFSPEANHGTKSSAEPGPMMLARFYGGVLHPMIHSGHIEFGMPGMLAEGLAQCCVTELSTGVLFPEEFFSVSQPTSSAPSSTLEQLTLEPGIVSSGLRSHTASIRPVETTQSLHSFTIIANMLADDRLSAGKARSLDSAQPFADTLKNVGNILREYAQQWSVPADGNISTLQEKIEELQWLSAIVFGIGGWKEGHKFRSDFFLMHILTSSIFLPSLAAFLSPSSQSALLRGHFSLLLAYWVSRGRPALPIEAFLDSVTTTPSPPGSKPKPSADVLSSKRNLELHQLDNPWLNIIQSVLHHPDEHLVKTIRALQHYARIYGERQAGTFKGTGLKGAEKLDGTLFVRVAGNAMDALGWVREGDTYAGDYDRAGLGWDETWD